MNKLKLILIAALVAVSAYGCTNDSSDKNIINPTISNTPIGNENKASEDAKLPEPVPDNPENQEDIKDIANESEAVQVEAKQTEETDTVPEDKVINSVTWPENDFTALLPKPYFLTDDVLASTTKNNFAIIFPSGVTIENAYDYMEEVKSYGFTQNPDENSNDVDSCYYKADSESGYQVYVTFYKGMFSVTLDILENS